MSHVRLPWVEACRAPASDSSASRLSRSPEAAMQPLPRSIRQSAEIPQEVGVLLQSWEDPTRATKNKRCRKEDSRKSAKLGRPNVSRPTRLRDSSPEILGPKCTRSVTERGLKNKATPPLLGGVPTQTTSSLQGPLCFGIINACLIFEGSSFLGCSLFGANSRRS